MTLDFVSEVTGHMNTENVYLLTCEASGGEQKGHRAVLHCVAWQDDKERYQREDRARGLDKDCILRSGNLSFASDLDLHPVPDQQNMHSHLASLQTHVAKQRSSTAEHVGTKERVLYNEDLGSRVASADQEVCCASVRANMTTVLSITHRLRRK